MPRSSQITDAGPLAKLTVTAAATPTIVQALTPRLGAPSNAGILAVPGTGRLRSRIFDVQITGSFTAAADSTIGVTLQVGTDTNPANNTTIATLAPVAMTAAAGTCSYELTARLIWNNVSGKLEGTFSGIINNTVVAPAAITGSISGLVDANEPVFNMVYGVTQSVVNAASYVTPHTFAIEA